MILYSDEALETAVCVTRSHHFSLDTLHQKSLLLLQATFLKQASSNRDSTTKYSIW